MQSSSHPHETSRGTQTLGTMGENSKLGSFQLLPSQFQGMCAHVLGFSEKQLSYINVKLQQCKAAGLLGF